MKKKMLGLLLSTAMLATTVAGCGSTAATTASAPAAEETAKTEAAESTAADTADTETEAGDGSELAYAGELEIIRGQPVPGWLPARRSAGHRPDDRLLHHLC